MAEAADPIARALRAADAAARRRRLDAFVETLRQSPIFGMARRSGAARLWYEPHLDRIHEDAETRRADLIQLEQIACGYPSRERFLTELTLDPPDATSDQAGVPLLDEDYLILSTIHSAKGQEWKSVYLLNVVDGCMPSDLGAGTSAETRGRTSPALRRHDPRKGRSPSGRAAALLHPRSARAGRSSSLCIQDALHSRKAARTVRAHELADSLPWCGCSEPRPRATDRHRSSNARHVALGSLPTELTLFC